jgi:TonB family protein
VTAPRVTYHPEPDYPRKGRDGKKEGTVVLKLVVGSDGLTRNFEVVNSLSPGFDKEAISAVKKWRFAPATKDGKPVAAQISVQVSFRLY